MKHYYFEAEGRKQYVTGKRGSWQWVNHDIPDVYTKDGDKVIAVEFPSYKTTIWATDEAEAAMLEQFVDLSDRAFSKHFAHKDWCNPYRGLLKSKVATYY